MAIHTYAGIRFGAEMTDMHLFVGLRAGPALGSCMKCMVCTEEKREAKRAGLF